jgi:putative tryptophan/tyrosine transport system substrate-binding protein
MQRRELLAFLCSVVVAPKPLLAQSNRPVLIGWLSTSSRELGVDSSLRAFKDGMAALGWQEGSTYLLEERWGKGRLDRLPTLVEELKIKEPAVIIASTSRAVAVAAKAAPGIPIVQDNAGDPVEAGLATSFARPGGMVTGVSNMFSNVSAKYLELLLAAAPTVKRVGFVVDSNMPDPTASIELARRAATRSLVEARFAEVAKVEDIERALSRLAEEHVQGLVILPNTGLINVQRRPIVKFALAQHLPVVAGPGPWVEVGALLTYGANTPTLYRRAAHYVDRILKGAKPGELPIEQPTRFELVINAKTAKALGLKLPQELLLRADKVIE